MRGLQQRLTGACAASCVRHGESARRRSNGLVTTDASAPRLTSEVSLPRPGRDGEARADGGSILRIGFLVLVVVLVTAYTAGVITGRIAEGNRIDLAHLALIAVAALAVLLVVQPDSLARIRRFKAGSVELEMLEQVKETRSEVRDLRLILPLLLPPLEQKHLLNLADGKTKGYRGSSELRGELRRLRYLGLVRMRGTGYIADMKDGHEFDLADYLALTELGERWVDTIKEMVSQDQGRG